MNKPSQTDARTRRLTAEERRLEETRARIAHWRRWGPYLADRQWGTVREDYSPHGTAWNSFPHDHARSRAYRWGEDVKEYYFYVDSTPTHSYMRALYKYPHASFPYDALVDENRRRDRRAPEYELIDTGVFDDDRYFDVTVEYAKATTDDILVRLSVANRGPEPAELHLLPTLWYRNTWSWDTGSARPRLRALPGQASIEAEHGTLGRRWLHCEGEPDLLLTDNESNLTRLWGVANASPYVKDGINDYLVEGRKDAVNPEGAGTKAAAHYRLV